mmetsp:Transcript_72288/g.209271  ORF Transcript_72288/g.209271 Transcript_72288/m.209271 type:complete len:203 (-) Transcript_72288:73-681(-)
MCHPARRQHAPLLGRRDQHGGLRLAFHALECLGGGRQSCLRHPGWQRRAAVLGRRLAGASERCAGWRGFRFGCGRGLPLLRNPRERPHAGLLGAQLLESGRRHPGVPALRPAATHDDVAHRHELVDDRHRDFDVHNVHVLDVDGHININDLGDVNEFNDFHHVNDFDELYDLYHVNKLHKFNDCNDFPYFHNSFDDDHPFEH